jgi:hypothetical protein
MIGNKLCAFFVLATAACGFDPADQPGTTNQAAPLPAISGDLVPVDGIRIVPATGERGDVIRQPGTHLHFVHAGQGTSQGDTCPDVSLPDAASGLTVALDARPELDLEYRVRFGDRTVRDWTSIDNLDGDVRFGLGELGGLDGTYLLDLRIDGGRVVTACWNHHLVSAPARR